MAIDWAATGSWMQAWAGFAGAGAVVYAAYIGTKTYKTWLRQRQAERKLHAAEQVLIAAHKCRSVLRSARRSIVSHDELQEAEQALLRSEGGAFSSLAAGRKKRCITAQVVLNRFAREQALMEDFFATLPLAYAIFGKEVEQSLHSLTKQMRIVRVAAEAYAGVEDDDDPQFIRGVRRDLFADIAMNPEDDKVGTEVAKIIADIEAVVRPILRSEA